MNRKWAAFAVSMFSGALFLTSVTLANHDEDSPLHKIMEKVQGKNSVITKGVRNKVSYTKAQKDIQDAAEALVKLGKEAKPYNEGAKNTKGVDKPVEKWDALMDDYVKEAEIFAKLVAKSDTDQPKAKDAYKAVSKTCAACHDIFRKEE